MMFKTAALAGLLLASAAPALAMPQSDCLRNADIYGFKALNDRTVIVDDRSHRKFKIKLIGTCQNLAFKEALAFKVFGGSQLSCISRGDEIITHDTMGFSHTREVCSISRIEPYTPAMEAADKAARDANRR